MRATLFRQDAVEFSRQKVLGSALLAAPLSLRIITAASSALAACLIAFAYWGQYTPKVRVSGYLAPSGGLIRIFATQTGTLIEQHVTEGQQVRQGDILFVLSTEEGSLQAPLAQTAAIETIEERLASLRREVATEGRISDTQSQGIREQLRDTRDEVAGVQAEIGTQGQRVAMAERTLQRFQSLLPQGVVAEVQVQQKRDESLQQQMHLQELKRTAASLQREIDKLSRDLGEGGLQSTNQREAAQRRSGR